MEIAVFAIIIGITIAMIVYGIIEYQVHQNNLNQIPVRIHVNGTRGKSSVTRLIGAGLRVGGYNTITKVTGTFPRMILSDGTEVEVHRKQGANILEQLNIIKYCKNQNADVLLIECMALNPIYQRITEHQMVKATHGIITNIRLDHLDVMGPHLENVGEALSLTIPKASKLFTAEDRMLDMLQNKADKLGTEVFAAKPETVSNTEMEGFTYIEHPENVALALSICEDLGVDRAEALAAMKKTTPDEGALTTTSLEKEGKKVKFYNALAANDPESSVILWKSIKQMEGEEAQYCIVLNARKDRIERSETLMDVAAQLGQQKLFITGENVDLVENMAKKRDMDLQNVVAIPHENSNERFTEMVPHLEDGCVVVAFGNMGAGGAEFAKYLEEIA